jgi:glucose/arabinose dehydrogenase
MSIQGSHLVNPLRLAHGWFGALTAGALALALPAPAQTKTIRVVPNFGQAVDAAFAPQDRTRLYVAYLSGEIRVWTRGIPTPALLLDLNVGGFAEEGLFSFAFAPDFATSRQFFVCYADAGSALYVERYRTLPGDPQSLEPGSKFTLLGPMYGSVGLHFGGCVRFGPDGLLYVGFGDGGFGPNGQATNVLLGKLLRFDRDGGIPPTNPLPGSPVIATGLRNPWRISFDRVSGELYIGDVGQASFEEVNRLVPGAPTAPNFGWATTEGPFNPATYPSFTLPHFWYPRVNNSACAILGGHVYRGCAIAALQGRFVYADYCTTKLRSFDAALGGSQAPLEHATTPDVGVIGGVVATAEDADGELYLCCNSGVFKLVPQSFADCNGNWVDDVCDIAAGTSTDIDGDGVPDECGPCPVSASYCTSGTSANGCVSTMGAIGAPSVAQTSGFVLEALQVDAQRQGRLFYGVGGASNAPWAAGSNSFLCVASPTQRLPVQSSGGTLGACDGRLFDDWLAYVAAHSTALGRPFSAGQVVRAQAWFRDPASPRGTSLSDALAFVTCP